jgi:DtxR family Mn-dependent transcriptional regulator
MTLSEKAEEVLEAMWIASEEEEQGFAEIKKIGIPTDDPAFQELTTKASIEIKGDRL